MDKDDKEKAYLPAIGAVFKHTENTIPNGYSPQNIYVMVGLRDGNRIQNKYTIDDAIIILNQMLKEAWDKGYNACCDDENGDPENPSINPYEDYSQKNQKKE